MRTVQENPTPPMIEAVALHAGYGGVTLVRDMDLYVNPGEVVALLGANGAGKSTTLMTLSGTLKPVRGTVRIEGTPTTSPLHKRARAGLAYVPEERSVIKRMTCRDNLRLGDAQPDGALEIFPELRSRLNVRGGLLSGGEQQMLTLGRALSRRPRVLLADELSLGLAPLVVKRLLSVVRSAADAGCAVLLVEQHIREALAVADRIYVLHRGAIELSGPAKDFQDDVALIAQRYLGAST